MQKEKYWAGRRGVAAFAVGLAALTFSACTTTLPDNRATPTEQRAQINEGADATLKRLYQVAPGWTAGVDATIAVATVGATGHIDTNTAKEPVVGFAMTNAGLMAGVSLEGAKIERLDL